NPYFARAMVNRLWRWMMGRAFVEPVDDLAQTNPATHPELLDVLARDFVEHGCDFRRTLRLIATSDAYGRSARTLAGNAADEMFYSHALVRPLEAEVLADAISDATGVPEAYGDEPAGTRAIQHFSPTIASPALDILGRCDRTDSCEVGAGAAGSLSKTLHVLNGPLLNRRLAAAEGWLQTRLRAGADDGSTLEEAYLRTLSRLPSDEERDFWRTRLTTAGDEEERQLMWEDLFWSLLSCREFTTNH
ncbi:MAG: DUF1553 domain-containing protein, partial [Planctomycetes bacterium]|nr:DUF1553 domain-containing protein [Planctomycetota bacterium]